MNRRGSVSLPHTPPLVPARSRLKKSWNPKNRTPSSRNPQGILSTVRLTKMRASFKKYTSYLVVHFVIHWRRRDGEREREREKREKVVPLSTATSLTFQSVRSTSRIDALQTFKASENVIKCCQHRIRCMAVSSIHLLLLLLLQLLLLLLLLSLMLFTRTASSRE